MVEVGDAAVDTGCDLDGYPVRTAPRGTLCVSTHQWRLWQQMKPPAPASTTAICGRITELEAQITHLRSLLNRIAPERLSVGWEHLPDVAAPPARTMPARALRGGDGVPR